MNGRSRRPFWIAIALASLAVAAAALIFWIKPFAVGLPGPGSEKYEAMVSAFFTGVSALDSDASTIARDAFTKATTIVPEEPAAWANLALAEIRLGHFDTAVPLLSKAQSLAPDNGDIERIFAILENRRGRFPESIEHLKRAVAIDPADIRSRYALVQELERQEGGDADALAILGEIVKAHPRNLAALIDQARLAAKLENKEVLSAAIRQLGEQSSSWPEKARDQYKLLAQAAAGTNPRLIPTRVLVLRNVLLSFPAFRQSIEVLMLPVGSVGEPIATFLRLQPPPAVAAPPDLEIGYKPEKLSPVKAGAIAIVPGVDAVPPAVLAIDGRQVRRSDGTVVCPFPGGTKSAPPTLSGVLASDWTSDGIMDLVLGGAGGLAFLRGEPAGGFTDVTTDTKLDPEILDADVFGVWAADIEMDGDLDIIVAPRKGPARILINRGDGSFHVHAGNVLGEGPALRGFAWADFDHDGDPDAATIDDRGVLRIVRNERSGRFEPWKSAPRFESISALTVADADSDGAPDILLLGAAAIVRLSSRDDGGKWAAAEIARRETPSTVVPPGSALLVATDLDNNGAIDFIASDVAKTELWLGTDGAAGWVSIPARPFRAFAAADLNRDGQIDLAGLTDSGELAIQTGEGTKDYGWLSVLPRAAKTQGDGRINSFGVGGEVQVRAGLLFQAQVIAGPSLHFGLGNHVTADVARVIWPNGTMQAEFNPKAETSLAAQQRLKGSCPFLYAFNGETVEFVTDFLWRSPLGLRINAQETAGVSQTEDRVKIRRDQLAASDGHTTCGSRLNCGKRITGIISRS
jgi:Tfp pilus assembly protein PilF